MKNKSEKLNEKVEEEIKLERTHPEEIIADELAMDVSQDEAEEENPELQKSSLRLVLITIAIVAGLVYGIFLVTNIFSDSFEPTSYTYNGFSFTQEDGIWYTTFQRGDNVVTLPFHYGPKDLADISIEVSPDRFFDTDFIYLSIPPVEVVEGDEGLRIAQAAVEVGKVVGTRNNVFNIPAKAVLSSPSDVDPFTDVVTCQNATSDTNVIMFLLGDENIVYEHEPYCFFVQGVTGRDTIKSANRLVYRLLGIMD